MKENAIIVTKLPNIIFVIASILVYKKRVVIDFTETSVQTALRLANHVVNSLLNNVECKNKQSICTISRSRSCITISVSPDNTIPENSLKQYLTKYKNNKLTSCLENVYKWSKLEKNFKTSISKDIILSSVKIDTVEHLPVIMQGYFDKTIDIIGMRFRITVDDTMYTEEKSPFICKTLEDELINNNFQNYSLTCSLDLTKYINDNKDNDNETKTTTKNSFTKQQKEIYNYVKQAIEDSNSITRNELYKFCKRGNNKNKDKALSKAICELNKKYMLKNNIDRKLLEFDDDFKEYSIIKPVL